ncbi:NADP-dependent oxidoreductase [Herbaspirillum seropedicae]|uniref:NADP-dependent oxidoreductase protein n=1 Tax=Herbaspirillum seropedicae (strain SmR1) TaxID=757424 RepID=D8IRD6_HERSS|nr:NADP-dependent oxidoreductase [Herbaspirillum seropedicae]ADJ65262.1 NADP-dependent oxidoreductase protein [Herbaspirillum seropedicae SmR1]AKN67114.1 2-alkenal reductase [Herbaspirillum seropedicae]NQE30285.1 2-alkenal reductase [Herbaspirillum seropedicae]UMU23119.1 NADP-dependent oxidoreductase [Herbaspirillum seropedicae]
MTKTTPQTNRRIVLASRPTGAPTADNFRLEEVAVPALEEGQLLLRGQWLSLDPYMRGRMSDAPSYAPPVEIGGVMTGGVVSRVEASRHPEFKEGDLVMAYTGWQEYAVSDGTGVNKLPAGFAHPSHALGVLGMPGYTAYAGLIDIGQPRPGETVVVAAATGAVGSLVGQIAKLRGCHVVGIAGGAQKCEAAVKELGFDACIDHRAADFPEQLKAACPRGIDVYFENVGGAVLDAVFPLLNIHARVPVCGLIAHYNGGTLATDSAAILRRTLTQRMRVQGFIIFDYYVNRPDLHAAFQQEVGNWLKQGKLHYREDVVQGLENAPEAFMGLLQGKNFGKLVVKLD